MELNPQQQAFLKYYLDPKSETWGNAYRSALKAEYSEEYASNITGQMPDWLSENISKTNLVIKAEKNLEKALDGSFDDTEKGGKPIQYKATEFTLKSLKKQDYSERTEHTGANGSELQPLLVKFITENGNEKE